MKQLKEVIFLLGILVGLCACNRNNDAFFNEIYTLTEQNDFFKAKELYKSYKDALPKSYQQFTEAVLANAFNQLEESENLINDLLNKKSHIPDSLQFKMYEVRYDNAVKLYNYKEAKNTIQTILRDYKSNLNSETIGDYENGLKIWNALENTPVQKVDIKETTRIKMIKDMAGLNTLKVFSNEDSLHFIFDTGANLSTTSQTVAQQLKMNIIPVEIEVGTVAGIKVLAQLVVCNQLTLGNIDMYNVIFLVLPDEALSFSEDRYRIYGVLGFPVIEALHEIRITQDGNFIVPREESNLSETSNMAMKELTPLICINNKHFTFDTGADETMLYNLFYLENKEEIEKQYQLEKISFSGAGGKKEFDGFKIDYTFSVGGKEVPLKGIHLLKEKIENDETVYGNIGQDLIQQFDSMIHNFSKMHIKFE